VYLRAPYAFIDISSIYKKKNTSHRVIFNLTKLRLKINPKGLVQVARALVLVTFPSSLSLRFESPLV
jgi:hypothetical protein